MKICLDIRYKTESGASSYIHNLVPQILKIDRKNNYTIIKYPQQTFEGENVGGNTILSPNGNFIFQLLWDMFVLPFKLKVRGIEIYHPLKNPGIVWGTFKRIFTVHSINIDYHGTFPTSFRRYFYHTLFTNYFTKKCTRVIVVSDFLRNFTIEELHIDREKIDTIYHGIDKKFQKIPQNKIAEILIKYKLPQNYILSVGNITPVKNHLTTIKAFAKVAEKINVNYVIVGSRKDDYFKEVTKLTKKMKLSKKIFFPGFIHSDDLPAVMNGAKILLFPSLTEGCPVTMLEAFACGLPIIASKRGGLWDVGKNCAEFVDDPLSDINFAVKLEYLLKSDKQRAFLSHKSLVMTKKFSWAIAAKAHLETYKSCCKKG